MASLFNIGVNGLQAQQAALSVTGQNITNANTPGYSRQRVDLASQTGSAIAGVFSGAGARVDHITRIADRYISDQIRTDQALFSEMDAFAKQVGQLENAIFDDGFGIDSALQQFFNAVQGAANDPSDLAMRQFVVSSGKALADRIGGVSERISQQQRDTLVGLDASARRVNELAGLIASVNDRITGLQDVRDSGAMNAMLDKRDELLKELATLVTVNTVVQENGQMNVFIGKGQSLVLGNETSLMEVTVDGGITLRPVGSATRQVVTNSIAGGEIGGILSYRRSVLNVTQNAVGALAAGVAQAFNDQHRLGLDLEGRFGGDFFRDINDPDIVGKRVTSFAASGNLVNAGTGKVNVYIDDPFTGVVSDYEFRVAENGSFTIERSTDGEVVFQGASISVPQDVAFDGIRVQFASGEYKPGDTLLISPYADMGNNLALAIADPSAVALASPVTIDASATNSGAAHIRIGAITDPDHPVFSSNDALMPPLLVRFTSATKYLVLDNSDPTRPVPLDPDLGLQDYNPGIENHILPYREGSSVVSSAGVLVQKLPGAAVLVGDLSPGVNGFPAGSIDLRYFDDAGFEVVDTQMVNLGANASAGEIAAAMNNLPGVHASAQTRLTLTKLINHESGIPVEIAINGTALGGFTDLNDLADHINADPGLQAQGITAQSDGARLQLVSHSGDDLTVHFQGDPNESVMIENDKGQTVLLNGNALGSYRRVTVGGSVAAILEPNANMRTQLDGVFAANPIHRRADFGFDVTMAGNVAAGDEFNLRLNKDGVADNRNGVALAGLQDLPVVGDPPRSFTSMFAALVQEVGVQANQANVNREAAGALLQQSESFRESISGVNLDEEAANLIRFEQAYNASAQIIAVAREIFNVLLNSVR